MIKFPIDVFEKSMPDPVEVLNLAADFGDQLDPYVREKYQALWNSVHENPTPARRRDPPPRTP